MAKNIADLNVRVTATTKGLQQGFDQGAKDARRFSDRIAGLNRGAGVGAMSMGRLAAAAGGALAAIRGAQAGRDFLFDGVRLAAEAEQAEVAFTTFLGSAERARDLLAEMREFAKETPFLEDEVRNASQMLVAFGVEADAIPATLRAIGDIASGTGTNLIELAEIYGKARTQGTLYAEDINQLTGRGIPIIQEFAKQFGVAESEVKKLGSEGKITFANLQRAFADLTGEGGKFSGLMERQSQTLAGRWSTLQGDIDAIKRSVGEGLVPVLEESMDLFTDMLGDADGSAESVAANVRSVSESVLMLGRKVSAVYVGLGAQIGFLIEDLIDGFTSLAGLVDQVAGTDYAEQLRSFGDGFEAEVNETWRKATNLWNDIDPPKVPAPETDAAEKSLEDYTSQIDQLAGGSSGVADRLRDQLATPFEKLQTRLAELKKAVVEDGLEFEIFERGVAQAKEEFLDASQQIRKELERDAPRALLKGSAEAIAAIAENQQNAAARAAQAERQQKLEEQVAQAERATRLDETAGFAALNLLDGRTQPARHAIEGAGRPAAVAAGQRDQIAKSAEGVQAAIGKKLDDMVKQLGGIRDGVGATEFNTAAMIDAIARLKMPRPAHF